MKAIKKTALITAMLLSASALIACGGSNVTTTAPQDIPEITGIIEGDGVVGESFGTIAGQKIPEASLPEKPAGAVPVKDTDGYKETLHKIYQANTKESIFKNHSSAVIAIDNRYAPLYDVPQYSYSKADCSYMYTSYYEQYSRDREIFQCFNTDTKNPELLYIADLSENYTGHVYWFVPEEESDFYDPAHEQFTDVFTNDGVLWVYSVMDETESELHIEDTMGGEYSGELINCILLADADTYELSEMRYYAEKDGKTYLLGINRFEYDDPEPEFVGSFQKQFDTAGKDTATITFIANPGKDNEVSKSITLPKKNEVSFYSSNIPEPDVYLDAECTKPVEDKWDRKSDVTYYIIPHEE